MIEFMLIAAPRSATAWAANWLTTDSTLCLHEPTARWSYQEWDTLKSERKLGVACTVSAIRNRDFLNAHPARKVILHRDIEEIRASMGNLGIPGDYDVAALDHVRGQHHDWRDLFARPALIYEYLLKKPFDEERHTELLSFNVQNHTLIRELQHAH